MEKIEKDELQNFPPIQRTINNLNTSNSVVKFLKYVGDSFIHPHKIAILC